MGSKVTIVGMEKLQAKLKKNVRLDDVKRVVRYNGAQMQIKAQQKAPVDTGTLKRSIGIDIKDAGMTAEVTPKAEYAPYVEFGTGQRGRESNIDRPEGISYKADWKGQTAQPYMSPSYLHAKNTGEVEQEVMKSIEQDIRKLESGK